MHIGRQINRTIRLTVMQLSGHLKQGRMHFRFGFQHFYSHKRDMQLNGVGVCGLHCR